MSGVDRLWDQVGYGKVPTWILAPQRAEDTCELRLGGPDLRVMVVLCARYNHAKGAPAFPSIETIALDAGMHPRDVRRSIKRLQEWRAIVVASRAGERQSNVYFVQFERPDEGALTPRKCSRRHASEGSMTPPNREQPLANQERPATSRVGVVAPGVESESADPARAALDDEQPAVALARARIQRGRRPAEVRYG